MGPQKSPVPANARPTPSASANAPSAPVSAQRATRVARPLCCPRTPSMASMAARTPGSAWHAGSPGPRTAKPIQARSTFSAMAASASRSCPWQLAHSASSGYNQKNAYRGPGAPSVALGTATPDAAVSALGRRSYPQVCIPRRSMGAQQLAKLPPCIPTVQQDLVQYMPYTAAFYPCLLVGKCLDEQGGGGTLVGSTLLTPTPYYPSHLCTPVRTWRQ